MRAIQLFAEGSSTIVDSFNFEDQSQASRKLWALDPLPAGFYHAGDQPPTTAAIIAAELKVFPQYDEEWVAKHVVTLSISANSQLTGFWQGEVPSVASAAAFYAVSFNVAIATRAGWGMSDTSNKAQVRQACRDVADSLSSLHLFAWRLGPWPMRLSGTLRRGPWDGSSIFF